MEYKYDNYNFLGYDSDGYDRQGYDKRGYDRQGYDRCGVYKSRIKINGEESELILNVTKFYHKEYGEGIFKGLNEKEKKINILFNENKKEMQYQFPDDIGIRIFAEPFPNVTKFYHEEYGVGVFKSFCDDRNYIKVLFGESNTEHIFRFPYEIDRTLLYEPIKKPEEKLKKDQNSNAEKILVKCRALGKYMLKDDPLCSKCWYMGYCGSEEIYDQNIIDFILSFPEDMRYDEIIMSFGEKCESDEDDNEYDIVEDPTIYEEIDIEAEREEWNRKYGVEEDGEFQDDYYEVNNNNAYDSYIEDDEEGYEATELWYEELNNDQYDDWGL